MKQNVTLLDGAIGTSLWKKTNDQRPVWIFNIEQPEKVQELAEEYIAAGSQVILTNTFAANRSNVSRESSYEVKAVVQAAVAIARKAVAGTEVKVGLDVGPLTEMMEPFGMLTEAEATSIFEEQIAAGMEAEAAPDLIYMETFIDLSMLEIAVKAAEKYNVPIFCSMAFTDMGFTIMGNSVDDFIAVMEQHPQVKAIGLNCNLTPGEALPVLAQFAGKTTKELIFKPNAGQPHVENGVTVSAEDAERFVAEALPAVEQGVKYMGGCCGTDPEYIRLLKEKLGK